MSHYCHVKICIRSRCQGNKLEIFNLFQFIILSHKPWLNAIVESCSQLKIKNFLQDGCGCSHGKNGSPCSRQFSEALILGNLRNCMELSQLDLVILANIQAFTYVEVSGEKWKRSHRSAFTFQARPICKEMFLRLYGISYSLVRRLKDHYEDNGISLRVMEITDDFHPTPHHKRSMKRWKTFWQITWKKMLFSQAGFQVLKRKTSSFCRPAKPKCLFGANSRKRVEMMQSATQNLFICGSSFIQTLLWQNPCLTFV